MGVSTRFLCLVCRDVTPDVDQQEQLRDIRTRLEYEATHDTLTGVPNRAAFLSFIEKALSRAGANRVGLLHIDLDNFKNMNDTHGHSAGDAVLVHAASVVRNTIKRSDLVARVGGDEFVVVCIGMTTLNELAQLANELIELISEPFEWNNRTLQGGTSIGAVLSQNGCTDAEELLVNADFALYEAKRGGRNQVALYDDAMYDHHGYLMRRSANLIDAVDTDALSYYFQPTMDLSTGDIMGFETLVRWEHTTDGVIPPDHFLPLAKDLGLMGDLDLLSMTAALKEKRRLSLAGFPDINIAFNASPELLAHPEFINRLIWGLRRAASTVAISRLRFWKRRTLATSMNRNPTRRLSAICALPDFRCTSMTSGLALRACPILRRLMSRASKWTEV